MGRLVLNLSGKGSIIITGYWVTTYGSKVTIAASHRTRLFVLKKGYGSNNKCNQRDYTPPDEMFYIRTLVRTNTCFIKPI